VAPAAIGVYAGILAALWHGGKIARAVRFASRGIYTELAGADFDVKREVEVVQGRNSASDARWLPSRVNRQVIPHLAYSAAWCHVNRQVIPHLAYSAAWCRPRVREKLALMSWNRSGHLGDEQEGGTLLARWSLGEPAIVVVRCRPAR
jgi:hypothetical protein